MCPRRCSGGFSTGKVPPSKSDLPRKQSRPSPQACRESVQEPPFSHLSCHLSGPLSGPLSCPLSCPLSGPLSGSQSTPSQPPVRQPVRPPVRPPVLPGSCFRVALLSSILGKVPLKFGEGPRGIWGRSLGNLGKVGKQEADLPHAMCQRRSSSGFSTGKVPPSKSDLPHVMCPRRSSSGFSTGKVPPSKSDLPQKQSRSSPKSVPTFPASLSGTRPGAPSQPQVSPQSATCPATCPARLPSCRAPVLPVSRPARLLSCRAPVNPDLYSYKEFKMQKIAKSGI